LFLPFFSELLKLLFYSFSFITVNGFSLDLIYFSGADSLSVFFYQGARDHQFKACGAGRAVKELLVRQLL
jgi:hypothetical protein